VYLDTTSSYKPQCVQTPRYQNPPLQNISSYNSHEHPSFSAFTSSTTNGTPSLLDRPPFNLGNPPEFLDFGFHINSDSQYEVIQWPQDQMGDIGHWARIYNEKDVGISCELDETSKNEGDRVRELELEIEKLTQDRDHWKSLALARRITIDEPTEVYHQFVAMEENSTETKIRCTLSERSRAE
jgi:hypothetical protein